MNDKNNQNNKNQENQNQNQDNINNEIDNIVIIEDEIEGNDTSLLSQQLKQQTDLNSQLKDSMRTFKAEFDNYRRRTDTALKNAKKEGEATVIEKLLPLADAFESAFSLVTDKNMLQGIELIFKQLNDIFDQFNVKKIQALNQEFNPEFHNAVLTKQDPQNSGKIIEVIKNGYTHGEKVLRYAFVVVAK